MKIGLLSSNFSVASARVLKETAEKFGHEIDFIDYRDIRMGALGRNGWAIYWKSRNLRDYDILIPRFFAYYHHDYKISLLEHLRYMGILTLNSVRTYEICKNKFRTAQVLQANNIPTPATRIAITPESAMRSVRNMKKPVVLKLLNGSKGLGVMKFSTNIEVLSVLETASVLDQQLIFQQYIENPGVDYRVFVVGGKAIEPVIKRKAKKGEFRSNINRGGQSSRVYGMDSLKKLAEQCSKAVDADILGVDIIVSTDGKPYVIELNCSPGFSTPDRAEAIIKWAEKKVNNSRSC